MPPLTVPPASIVEANLFIICASLPTLRKFLKHVAPKLVGESIYGRSSKGATGGGTAPPSALRTIGSVTASGVGKKQRNQYSQFDFADDASQHGGRNECIVMSRYSSGGVEDNHEDRVWADDGSERAIVKEGGKEIGKIIRTKTVTVEYHQSK